MGARSSGGFCALAPGEDLPMQVSNTVILEGDRIDPWSTDLGSAAEVPSGVLAVLSCGGNTAPPDDFLADSTHGSIVLQNLSEGPVFMDDEMKEDDRVVALDADIINERVGEVTIPVLNK
mmetsp:Transcript_110517/g.323336  ORF Transcript_110517/g.323336 Transcript_110517/m.323336 type:complete len:120 (+) Transcript_110517:245-604(+)